MPDFTCTCGLSFKTIEEIRKHIKACGQAQTGGFTCSHCLDSCHILLPYEEGNVCPTCAIFYETPIIVFGAPLINHMAKKYEEIFRKKAGALLECLKIEKLSDMGIVVTLITFSAHGHQFSYEHTPKGELIFLFTKSNQIPEIEEKNFEYVISHEVFHAYISHKLKLEITDSLIGPLTFLEAFSGSLAEDIQLTKIAVSRNVKPLIHDESKRVNILYKNLSVLPASTWKTLSDEIKFNSMISVTYTYATELCYKEILKDTHSIKQAKKNIRLVYPHYAKYGYPNLTKLIDELYKEKIAETKQEKQIMYKKILRYCDEWVESQGLNLY